MISEAPRSPSDDSPEAVPGPARELRPRGAFALLAGLAIVGLEARVAAEDAHVRAVELASHGEAGPGRLILAVEIDGRTASARWDEAMTALLRSFDRDGDDHLDRREAADLPSTFGLRQLAWGVFRPTGPAPAWELLDGDVNGRVGVGEMSRYFERQGLGPVALGAGQAPYTDRLNDALGRALDTDGDRRVDEAELRKAGGSLERLDRNGDGRLAADELAAWSDLLDGLELGRALITIRDHGRGLFEWIDSDHDGHLSARELRAAGDRLREAGCLVDVELEPSRLPRTVIGCISRGHQSQDLAAREPAGPGWFQAMDRNRDGDVSLGEWVGETAQFRAIDRDQDGLLSPEEAIRTP